VPRVIDVFPFFNELNLLELRLETLGPYVDYFIIVEADETFAGEPKGSYFLENQEKFDRFEKQIIHVMVNSHPNSLSPFEREWLQRNAILPKLEELANNNDIIVFGDVDEIPSPEVIMYAREHDFDVKPVIHCAQDLFYYYMNLKEVSGTLLSYSGEYPFIFRKKWLGSVIAKFSYLRTFDLATFRSPGQKKFGMRFPKGGWHFSFIGEAENLGVEDRIARKIRSYAHQEYNNESILNSISENVTSKNDLFGRKRSRFRKLPNLDSLPDCIQNNHEKYRDSLLP